MTEPSGADRRRVMRFSPQGARVTAHRAATIMGLFGGGKDDVGGDVLDVSPMGLRWNASKKVELGTHLKMELTYKACKPLTVEGIVRWAHAQGGGFVIGAEFAKLDDAQIALLEAIQQQASRDSAARQ